MSDDLPDDLAYPSAEEGLLLSRAFAWTGALLGAGCLTLLAYAIWWMP